MELLKGVGEKLRKNEAVYPCEVLECVKGGSDQKRRETDRIGERPQLVRAKSLEDQMLVQSSYGPKGEFFIVSISFRVKSNSSLVVCGTMLVNGDYMTCHLHHNMGQRKGQCFNHHLVGDQGIVVLYLKKTSHCRVEE